MCDVQEVAKVHVKAPGGGAWKSQGCGSLTIQESKAYRRSFLVLSTDAVRGPSHLICSLPPQLCTCVMHASGLLVMIGGAASELVQHTCDMTPGCAPHMTLSSHARATGCAA